MDRETKELQQVASIDEENTKNLSNRTNFLKDDCIENSQVEDSNINNHDNDTKFNSKNEPIIIESDQTKVSVSGNEVPDEDGNHTKEIEIDLNVHDESVIGDDPSLYDDVMGTGIIRDCRGSDSVENSNSTRLEYVTSNSSISTNSGSTLNSNKRVCCYVGNLTWWTNDQDLTNAIASIHVTDLIDIKFYENKVNGQSKGFALVSVASDSSFRTLIEKLPRIKINGQDPVVTQFNRHFFAQFEEQARKEFPSTAGTNSTNNNLENHSQTIYASNQQSQFYMNSRNRNFTQSNSSGLQTTGLPLSRPNISNTVPLNSILMNSRSLGQSHNFSSIVSNGNGTNLVGSFQSNHSRIGPPHPQQQSLLGNNPPGLLPLRPSLTQASGFIGSSNTSGRQGNGIQLHQPPISHQQTSLLGNRPGVGPTNTNVLGSHGPGLLPMRPGMTPILSSNSISQSPGLLNNPTNIQARLLGISGQQSNQNNWERTNNLTTNGGQNLLNSNMHISSMNINQRSSTSQSVNPTVQSSAITQQMSNSQFNQTNQYTSASQPGTNLGINGLIGVGSNLPHNNHSLYQQPTQLVSAQVSYNTVSPHQISGYTAQNNVNQAHFQSSNHTHQSIISENAYSGALSTQNYQRQSSSGPSNVNNTSSSVQSKLSEIEFQDALEKNRIISSQAISRAVQDASIGQYASAIETLITAISLIKQSKISYDERCKIFAASLEDTKQGIEDKYYGSLNIMQLNPQQTIRVFGSGSNLRDTESQDRSRSRYERSRSRSRSRDSRDRDRERVCERESSSSKDHRSHHRREKHHHRSSHRDRDRDRDCARDRSRERSRERRIVSIDRDEQYYEDTNKYHRSSRH